MGGLLSRPRDETSLAGMKSAPTSLARRRPFSRIHPPRGQRECDFPLDPQSLLMEFPGETVIVDRFHKAGAQASMHLDGKADDLLGKGGAGFQGPSWVESVATVVKAG
jgi:hypothetical protein